MTEPMVKDRSHVVEVRNLGVRMGRSQILHDINLVVYRGEILGLIGASGSGKTTLLRRIIGLSKPDTGTIRVLGESVGFFSDDQAEILSSHWGVLFQNGALFSALTVFDNIAFPIRELRKRGYRVDERDIHALVMLRLEMVGLAAETAWKLPAELSGGMVKRVALARALVLDAEILFLDEPTAGLDPYSASEFDRLLKELHAEFNLSVLMVTHDLNSLAALCDRVAVLDNGVMLATGSLAEVAGMEDPFIRRFFHGERGTAVLNQLGRG